MDLEELLRWYERGKEKMERNLRIETIVNKLLNLDIYNREMQELNIKEMERIKFHHHKVIMVDTDSSGYNTEEEEEANAADDCEHSECHAIKCMRDPKVQRKEAQARLMSL